MNKIAISLFLATAWFAPFTPAFAAEEGLTREQGDAIIRQLGNIERLLQGIERKLGTQAVGSPRRGQPAPTVRASISTKGRPSLGRNDAPVTLVEFTDYQCPFCNRFFMNTLPKIKEEFIDTGKARLVIKDVPLAIHKNARPAAQAAHCAGEQDHFWPMHDILFKNSTKLDPNLLPDYARELSLDMTAFSECLENKRHLAAIDKDADDARLAGIRGTPSFVVGKSAEDIINGIMIRGAQPYQAFAAEINKLLNLAKVAQPEKTSDGSTEK